MNVRKNSDNNRKIVSEELLHKINSKQKKNLRPSSKKNRLIMFRIFHRAWHILFSIPFLLLALIAELFLLLRWLFTRKPVFIQREIYGKGGVLLKINYFNTSIFRNLSLFFHVFTGELNLTGYSLNRERESGDAFIYDYSPGIVNLWYIRSASRTAYEGKKETDKKFVSEELMKVEINPCIRNFIKLIKSEFLLLIRFLVAKIFHGIRRESIHKMIDPIYLFSTKLRNLSMSDTLLNLKSIIINYRDSGNDSSFRRKIFFVNPDCFNRTYSSQFQDYRHLLRHLDSKSWVFADGIGINIAADIMGYPKNENVNGTDIFPRLCELSIQYGFSFYFLGAKPGVAAQMSENIQKEYPGLNVAGYQHGYFDREKESREIVNEINRLDPDFILVAMGVPFQERWIDKWFDDLRAPVVMGVGGLFDFYSGRMKRAPRWMRDIGLEWAFRLMMEPGRMFKRYIIGNPLFLIRVRAIKKSYLWLVNNRLKKVAQKGKTEVIQLDKCSIFKKNRAELLDIMPLLFSHCSREKIPVYLCCRENADRKVTDLLKCIFPELIILIPKQQPEIGFSLIIYDHLPESNDLAPASLCIVDNRFFRELKNFQILENAE